MYSSNTPTHPNGAADQLLKSAERSADQAIEATRRATGEALDSLSDTVHEGRNRAAPVLERAAAIASRGAAAVRDGSERVRERALRASDSTVGYIRDEPVKAMLIAAATGAALMAILGVVTRSRR